MTDENPELTPAEQYKQDMEPVQVQSGVIDVTETVSNVFGNFFGGGPRSGVFARTSFEGHDLNAMIDLVEGGNPKDLENAGRALWEARTALNDAAAELEEYVNRVGWKGEAGSQFRTFGTSLVEHAEKLGVFADAAATQITLAGTGLASTHMPERDTRLVKAKVEDLPLPKRVEGNADYEKAVQVEKNRQEAINRVNRLASFYAVSEQTLAGLEPPTFDRRLQARVPPPTGDYRLRKSDELANKTLEGGPARDDSSESVSRRVDLDDKGGTPRSETLDTVKPLPERDTSMEIDTVATPPASVTVPGSATLPSSTGPAGSAGGGPPPLAGGFANLAQPGGPRQSGTQGAARSAGQSGRLSRPAGPGGSSATGGPGTAGRSGAIGSGSGAGGQKPVGRSGGTGMGGRGVGGAGSPHAGRSNGIVGGKPQRPASGSAASRIPRGTVVGGDGAAAGRANAARPGQPGSAGRNGVVGTPRGNTSRSRPGAGFTQGGAGLVRGPAGGRRPEDEEQEDTGSRPDYLVEDEETWAAGDRGAVPPVIE